MSLKKLLAGVLALGMCACGLNYTNAMKPAKEKNYDIPKPPADLFNNQQNGVNTITYLDLRRANEEAAEINRNGIVVGTGRYAVRGSAHVSLGAPRQGLNPFFLNVYRGANSNEDAE
jgi:hypothetical protein